MSEKLLKVNELKNKLKNGSGNNVARKRIEKLFDEGTFIESGQFINEGVVTGYGQVNGRLVYVASEDKEVSLGAFGKLHAEKIIRCQNDAMKVMAPIVYLNDSIGVKLLEGDDVLSSYAKVLKNNSVLKGIIPQISVNFNQNVGLASFASEMSDFIFSLDDKNVDFFAENEDDCISKVRVLISYLPQNYIEKSEIVETYDDLNRIIPELNDIIPIDDKTTFDMNYIIKMVADNNVFIEVKNSFANNMLIGYIRLGGITVGVVANNSNVLDGKIDKNAIDKAVKFIEICDLFNIPILTFVDNDGMTDKEASELVNVYALAETPIVTVLVRRAYGSGYVCMGSKDLGADIVYAYPEAKISVMKADALVNILYEKEISKSENVDSERAKRIKELNDKIMSPEIAASIGIVDDVIEPASTRKMLIAAFDMLQTKNI